MTPLDTAHAAMAADPDNAVPRMRFYDRLVDAELILLLERPAEDDKIVPTQFPLEDGPIVLAFDTEERLATFAGPAPYAVLSGRALAAMLTRQGIGIGLNLDVAPSSFIIPAAAVDWLAETLMQGPTPEEDRPKEVSAPSGLPETLLTALDSKLPAATGLAQFALLAAVTYESGRRGHLLGFIDARPGAEPALAQAVSEALIFSGIEAGELDVSFFTETDPLVPRLTRVSLRFDLPQPEIRSAPDAPGTDPDRPPRLR